MLIPWSLGGSATSTARNFRLVVAATYRVPLTDLPSFALLPRAVSFTARQAQPIDPYASR